MVCSINVAILRPNKMELILGLLKKFQLDPCMPTFGTIYNNPPLLHAFVHFVSLEVVRKAGLVWFGKGWVSNDIAFTQNLS